MTNDKCQVDHKPMSTDVATANSENHQLEEADLLAGEAINYDHQCYICDKTFSANSNLNRHLRKIHQESVQSPYNNIKCVLCGSLHSSSSLYIDHLEKDHRCPVEVETLTFDTRQAFEDWKLDTENRTRSQFIKSRGQKRSGDNKKTYFSCNRSGNFVSKAKTQKSIKKQGSRKINGRCPAAITLTYNHDSSLKVKFIKTHVGHDFELKHLDLSEKDRDLIVRKLASGITKRELIKQIRLTSELHQNNSIITNASPTDISTTSSEVPSSSILSGIGMPSLNNLQPIVINSRSSTRGCGEQQIEVVIPTTTSGHTQRSNTSSGSPDELIEPSSAASLSRLHLATTKDIHNILNSKHLNSKKIRHNYDLNAIEHWIREMKEFGEDSRTVLFYKDQMEISSKYPKLTQDDFMLVIMKDGQANALRRFASKCVVIDSTHNVNCEYLHLTLMFVIDETDKNFPVAFMFSNRTDMDTLEVFYSLVRDKAGQITTRTLIADDLNDFYQAWWKVMSRPLHNLPTPWSVFDCWTRHFDLIKNREKLRKMKKQLKTLLTEAETDKFSGSLKQILSTFKQDSETSDFINYFDEQFAKNPDVWSSCLRNTFGVSNHGLWLMHDKFKTVYKEGKSSRRMCKYITCLMDLFEDHQLKIVTSYEESTNRSVRLQAMTHRHQKGVASGCAVYEVAVEPTYWLCPSECLTDVYDEIRHVARGEPINTLNEMQIKCCDLHCSECKTCRHEYKCTCLDYVVNLEMCKHIHRISALCKQDAK